MLRHVKNHTSRTQTTRETGLHSTTTDRTPPQRPSAEVFESPPPRLDPDHRAMSYDLVNSGSGNGDTFCAPIDNGSLLQQDADMTSHASNEQSLWTSLTMDNITNLDERRCFGDPLLLPEPTWLLDYQFDWNEMGASALDTAGRADLTSQFQSPSDTIERPLRTQVCPETNKEIIGRSWFTYIDGIDDLEGGIGLVGNQVTPAMEDATMSTTTFVPKSYRSSQSEQL